VEIVLSRKYAAEKDCGNNGKDFYWSREALKTSTRQKASSNFIRE